MNKCPKFGRAMYQEWQMQFDLILVLIRLFISPSFIFVFFKVSGHFGGGMYLKSQHLVPGQTINVFDAIFGIFLSLISKNKAVRQMAGFWMINSHFGEF